MMELDYKTMFEETLGKLNDTYATHEEMCKCATLLQENQDKATIAANHMFEMTLGEQAALMKAAAVYTELAAKLCDKYGWEQKQEAESDENN